MSLIKIHYLRHGDFIHGEKNKKQADLSDLGKKEMLEMAKNILVNPSRTIIYSVDNRRSIISALAVEFPNIPYENLIECIEVGKSKGHIVIPEILNYRKVNHQLFEKKLEEHFYKDTILQFLVNESDDIIDLNDRGTISTYNRIVRDQLFFIKRYIKIQKQIEKKNKNDLDRIICIKAFVYGCLRARINEYLHGIENRNNFANHFDQMVKEDKEKNCGTLTIGKNENGIYVKINDIFGEETLYEKDIDNMLDEDETHGSTCRLVPYYFDSEGDIVVGLLAGDKGDWFVGGKYKRGESSIEAIKRELSEEIEESDLIGTKNIQSSKGLYKYEDGEKPKQMHFFYTDVKSKISLNPTNKNKTIEWKKIKEIDGIYKEVIDYISNEIYLLNNSNNGR